MTATAPLSSRVRLLVALTTAVLAALFLYVHFARAETIVVAAGVVDVDGADGQCSLVEAIYNANNDAATHADCPAGAGADVLELGAGSTYSLSVPIGGFGLPAVTDELEVVGNGAIIRETSAGNFGLFNNGPGNTLTLRNMTLRNGSAQSTGGGAVYNSGHLITNNVTFLNNNAVLHEGGAIFVNVTGAGQSLRVINSTFENNHAAGNGGAIYGSNNNWSLVVRNSTFINNSSGANGGAIYLSSDMTQSEIAHSTFDLNDANFAGGAIFAGGGNSTLYLDTVTITNSAAGTSSGGVHHVRPAHVIFSTIAGNQATTSGGGFGGSGQLTLIQSTVRDNIADVNGGGISNTSGIASKIEFSEISGNTAGADGGGYATTSASAKLTIRHSTFSGNVSGDEGGAIYNNHGTISMTYSTVVTNTAVNAGAGIMVRSSFDDSDFTFRNSVVASNMLTVGVGNVNCASVGASSTWTSLGYNAHGAGALDGCAAYFTHTNDFSLSVPGDHIDLTLADNGGRTRTHAVIGFMSLHNVIPDGMNACNAGSTLDQRGHTRAGGAGIGGTECDVGAHEYFAECATPTAPAVTISLSGADVVLSWTEPAEDFSTEIWRDADPYFDPTAPGNKVPYNVVDETYTFVDEAGDPETNRFYTIRGMSGCGTVSTAVDEVGLFGFAIQPGTP